MRTLGLAAVLALVLAGCTLEEKVPTTASRSPDPAARTGGKLTVGILKPASIDPSLATNRDPAGLLVASVLCDPPLSFDPVTGEAMPAIARRVRSHERGQNITATLRKDVEMHNGRKVGADDVTYALSRAAHPETVSPSSDLLREVRGYEALQDDRVDGDLLPGARVVGPQDLALDVPNGQGDLVRMLAHPIAAPLPKDDLVPLRKQGREAQFAERPVCTGPYRLADAWSPDAREIRLVRFAAYHGSNSAYTRGGAGYVEEILFRIYPDLASQLAAFRAGQIDIAHVPEDRRDEARTLGRLVDTPTSRLDYIGLPTTTPPFDQRGVRVAFSRTLDRRALVERVYRGGRVPARGLLPPTLGGTMYRSSACGVNAPLAGSAVSDAEDAEGVRALRGRSFPLYFNDEFGHRTLMAELARQWSEALGVRFELKPMGWDEYLQRGSGSAGFDGPFRMSWETPYPSPHLALFTLFDPSQIGSGNLTRFNDPAFERSLRTEARRANTPGDQAARYKALEDLVCGEMPAVPVTFGATHLLFRNGKVASAVGRYTDRTTALPLLRELYLAS